MRPPGEAAEPRRVVAYSLFWGRARGRGYGGRRHRLAEYEYGLWCAVRTARRVGWGVRVYHDGSVERVLRRMRAAFPPPALRCVRVTVAPDLRGRRYLGCLFRLLPADDPRVDVFLSRDLDDALDAAGLRRVAADWADRRPVGAGFHYQRERYDTPERPRMANMGWFGQRRAPGARAAAPSVAAAVARFARGAGTDYYTADEAFLTDVWIPALRRAGARGARLPSHAHRRALRRRAAPAAFRRFRARPRAPRTSTSDERVHLG